MERTTPFLSRRGLLMGAALTAVPYALFPDARAAARPQAVDHPGAAWHPASRSNYTPSKRPRAHPLRYVVIHVAQTTYSGTLSVFRNPRNKVSAHYVVRSSDGHVAQCVREADIAWHAGNWDYNTRSIGIEHEGWVDQPKYFTDAMYQRSARLTAAICARYDIPRNRAHIIGHHEVPGSDHTDPGRHWDWKRYMRLVDKYA
ncbi:N-acetylmuramoyl-L-alanine amidase [Streptomyces swartbergensis]|uniref:N-acetylmuramoyl-L-alanine amidase n=1 Tax=Streptomyces swartbergensis TaxID=487165 RepID=A0A243SAS2_9ACTN|nr:N-acetylmuramoyl-L-alanine amidase [Streptomyces swartbergensis]OUD04762.1 N-acetylmuramoyl-L-alanine amidase [Streptomyces swartbergensis]